MSPSSRGFWPIFFDTLIKSWWWWWWWWSKCNTTVAKNFRSSKLITGVHSSLFTAHRVLPVFRSLIVLSVLDLRASFRFGWGKFLRYLSLTVVIFHGVDNGLNTNSYNQRISVFHRSVRFRSSPPRRRSEGFVTRWGKNAWRTLKNRISALPKKICVGGYSRCDSKQNEQAVLFPLSFSSKFGQHDQIWQKSVRNQSWENGKVAWQQRTVTGVFLYFWLRKYLFMALKSI